VADDTPEGLRERSALHGAICLTVRKQDGKSLMDGIGELPEIDRSEVVSESEVDITLRLFPKAAPSLRGSGVDRIVRGLFEKGFSVETFFVEKGRLDEVFRMVTRPDSTTTDRA
jgi:ABC-2 type transport system ATP-binding protein